MITAVAVGTELCCRVGIGAAGEFHKRGLHASGIIAPLGAAAAVCRAGSFDPAQVQSALGLASSMGAGIMQAWLDGTDPRFVHNGHAAWAGVMAAALGEAGATGPTEALEGRYGLFPTHLQTDARLSLERITADLGTEWESRNVAIKPYPSGQVTHAFIDAVLALVRESSVKADDVVRATCFVADYIVPIACEPAGEKKAPRNAASARISLQYILAEAIVFGEIGSRSFTEERMHDPAVQRLAASIDYQVDPDAPPRGICKGWVRLLLRDGRSTENICTSGTGQPQDLMAAAAIHEKFLDNATGSLGLARAERSATLFDQLEQMEDVTQLASALLPHRVLP